MTILELANALKAIYDKHGDIEVMVNTDGEPMELFGAEFTMVENDADYPADYRMPAGFKFVSLDA